MAYDTAGNIISDAAAELGLGTVSDAYGSTDANIIQLRGLLKSAGRDIVLDRDWTHLQKEYKFITRPTWKASTAYYDSGANIAAPAWTSQNAYAVGDIIQNNGALYKCTTAGTSASINKVLVAGPTAVDTSIKDGTVVWSYLNSGVASLVVKGGYYYTCSSGGTSGTVGPTIQEAAGGAAGEEVDGTAHWIFGGNAADYALPSDWSNMIDQTGWNRTNRLPMGGPVDGQVWQYLKGRQQGVVFNVLFRPVAGLLRLYPDIDTPGGYLIALEYVSRWWVGANGSTTTTADAPTANADVIFFDPLVMVRRLKLDWLKAKGFDTTHAQREYDEAEEQYMNTDGSAEVLNLAGRGPFDPLLTPSNIPATGYGS